MDSIYLIWGKKEELSQVGIILFGDLNPDNVLPFSHLLSSFFKVFFFLLLIKSRYVIIEENLKNTNWKYEEK